jgi:uncharacterized protein YigE (DUF2233 family)
MLVMNGRLHPRFLRYSASRKRRSGVGVVSDDEVSFEEFGRLFRDHLECRNALFLDGGSVPSLYAPSIKRSGNILPMGPMIGVFARANYAPVP